MHTHYRILVLLVASLLIFGQLSMHVQAAITLHVNTPAETDDAAPGNGVCADSTGKCSLRAAVQEANALAGDDTINVPVGTYYFTKQLNITQNLTINGAGRNSTILDGPGSSGAKGLNISPAINVNINNLTLWEFPKAIYISGTETDHGQVFVSNSDLRNNSNADPNNPGSALSNYCEGCSVTLEQTNVFDNSSPGCGAIENEGTLNINNNSQVYSNHATTGSGGAICNDGGTLSVNMSIIRDNQASGVNNNFGGGIYQTDGATGIYQGSIQGNTADDGGGGIYLSGGMLSVLFSNVIGNSADAGSGGGLNLLAEDVLIETSNILENQAITGGGIMNWGALDIVNSAIVDNTATANGGALGVFGGELTLINTTLSGNQADQNGGGIYSTNSFVLKLGNVTISDNTADADNNNNGTEGGGGIYNGSGNSITIKNSIIAGNESLTSSAFEIYKPDCVGALISAGYNLIGKLPSLYCSVSGDLTGNQIGSLAPGIDPKLSPLTLGSYSTYHHPLQQLGPAIDRGNPAGCTDFEGAALTSDQRGELRVYGSGAPGYRARCDLGAIEFLPAPL